MVEGLEEVCLEVCEVGVMKGLVLREAPVEERVKDEDKVEVEGLSPEIRSKDRTFYWCCLGVVCES